MATISPDLSGIVDGAVGDAADWVNPFNTIINEFNGNISNANVATAAAIDVSKLASGAWTTWATTYAGFSADPTQSLLYFKVGRMVTVFAGSDNSTGTSNATTFTMTLPYAAVAAVRIPITAVDNTSNTTVGRADTAASSTTLTLYTSIAAATWTASGAKGVVFCFSYPSTS